MKGIANGDNNILSSYRGDDKMFGQLALESSIDKSIASNIISDLFERTNTDVTGKKYIN